MRKIGIIETVASIVPKRCEVIELDGGLFAGVDAFSHPNEKSHLLALESLSIPEEWRWTEQYAPAPTNPGPPRKNAAGKYQVIRGPEALQVVEGILSRHETGCLALNDKSAPYVIPMNHAWRDGKLYMHCGKVGKKLGLIRRNPSATYMIYGPAAPVPPNVRTCHLPYESILFSGEVFIVDDPSEKEQAIRELTDQYGTPYQHNFPGMIEILAFHVRRATARTGRFKPGLNRPLYCLELE